MATRKNVPAAAVRSWFAAAQPEGVPAPGSRGRLHPDTIAAFHKANPRMSYEPKVAEAPTVTVKVTMLDKAGRKTTRPMTVTTAEARVALGEKTSKRGRISRDNLADALSQREADKVAHLFK